MLDALKPSVNISLKASLKTSATYNSFLQWILFIDLFSKHIMSVVFIHHSHTSSSYTIKKNKTLVYLTASTF